MYARDYRNVIAGLLLVAVGAWAAIEAFARWDLGQLNQMGPGMLPAALGILLAGLGLLIAVRALFTSGTLPEIAWRPLVLVGGGILAFAVTVDTLGMVPAVVVLTYLSVFADNKLGTVGATFLAAALALIAYLVFSVGLGVRVAPFVWPF